MKKVVGYALAFTAGSLFSGTIAMAGSTYVKALIEPAHVVVGSKTVSSASALEYNGQTYFQAGAVTSALSSAGVKYSVSKSNLTLNPPASTSSGSSSSSSKSSYTGLSQTQNGLTIAVTGLKFTGGDVQISLRAINHTGSNVTIDDIMSETLTQGTHQLQADDMNSAVVRFPTTMANGVNSDAVLLFQGGSQTGGSFKLTLPVMSDNYNLSFNDYVFVIPANLK